MTYYIPDGIVEIDKEWVKQNISKDVTKVICPSSLRIIGQCAFEHYSNLKEIELNERLEYIGRYAFDNSGITSIQLPSSLKKYMIVYFLIAIN